MNDLFRPTNLYNSHILTINRWSGKHNDHYFCLLQSGMHILHLKLNAARNRKPPVLPPC